MIQHLRASEPGGISKVDPHGPSFSFKHQYMVASLDTLTVLETWGSQWEDAAEKSVGLAHRLRAVSQAYCPLLRMRLVHTIGTSADTVWKWAQSFCLSFPPGCGEHRRWGRSRLVSPLPHSLTR